MPVKKGPKPKAAPDDRRIVTVKLTREAFRNLETIQNAVGLDMTGAVAMALSLTAEKYRTPPT